MAENLVQLYSPIGDSPADYWKYAYYAKKDRRENIIQNSWDNFAEKAKIAEESAMNILNRENEGFNLKNTETFLNSLAEDSFLTEMKLYQSLFGDNHEFLSKIKSAYETKSPDYMKEKLSNGQPLYQALTYQIMSINEMTDSEDSNSGRWELIQILSSLTTTNIFQAAGAAKIEKSAIDEIMEALQSSFEAQLSLIQDKKGELSKRLRDVKAPEAEIRKAVAAIISESAIFNKKSLIYVTEDSTERKKVLTKVAAEIKKGSLAFDGQLYRTLQMLSSDPEIKSEFLIEAVDVRERIAKEIAEKVGDFFDPNSTYQIKGMNGETIEATLQDWLIDLIMSQDPIAMSAHLQNGIVYHAGIKKGFWEAVRKKLEDSGLVKQAQNNLESTVSINDEAAISPLIQGFRNFKSTQFPNDNLHKIIHTLIQNWNGRGRNGDVLRQSNSELEDFQARAWNFYLTHVAEKVEAAVASDAAIDLATAKVYQQSGLHTEIKALTDAMFLIKNLNDLKMFFENGEDWIKQIMGQIGDDQTMKDLEKSISASSKIEDNDEKKVLKKLIKLVKLLDKGGKISIDDTGEENNQSLSTKKVFDRISQLALSSESNISEELKVWFTQIFAPALSQATEAKMRGYVSTIQGSVGETIFTVLTRETMGEQVYQLGRARNIKSQQAHADIAIELEKEMGKVGIQAKIYKNNIVDLYGDSKVNFAADEAIRYLGSGDALIAFRFFLVNGTILNSIDNTDKYNQEFFIDVLKQRLDYFIRIGDGLSTLEDIKNNFYLINFNLVPTSSILFLLRDTIVSQNKQLITYTPDSVFPLSQEEVQYAREDGTVVNRNLLDKNILSFINQKAKFKGLTVNLNRLGGAEFNI